MALESLPIRRCVQPASCYTSPHHLVYLLIPSIAVIIATREAFLVTPVHGCRQENFVVRVEFGTSEHRKQCSCCRYGQRVDHHSVETLEIGLMTEISGE